MKFFENIFKKPGDQSKEIPLHEKPQDIPAPKPNIEEAPKAPNAPTPEKPKIENPLPEETTPKIIEKRALPEEAHVEAIKLNELFDIMQNDLEKGDIKLSEKEACSITVNILNELLKKHPDSLEEINKAKEDLAQGDYKEFLHDISKPQKERGGVLSNLKELVGDKNMIAVIAALAALSSLPSKSEAYTQSKESPSIENAGAKNINIYSPHLSWDEFMKGEYDWKDLGKFLLEPLAASTGAGVGRKSEISFDIPYEYARLFNIGKPMDKTDYEKLNKFVKEEITNQLKAQILAFSFDKEAFEKRFPGQLPEDVATEITNIRIIGSASPEARIPGSEQPGKIDKENLALSEEYRAKNAKESVMKALNEIGIKYDQPINTKGVETQFSDAEIEALNTIAKECKKEDIFSLIHDYNQGEIKNERAAKALDAIIGSKRNVSVYMEMKDGGSFLLIIPLPLLLLALPMAGRGARRGAKELYRQGSRAAGWLNRPLISHKPWDVVPEKAGGNYDGDTRSDILNNGLYYQEIYQNATTRRAELLHTERLPILLSERRFMEQFLAQEILETWMVDDNEIRAKKGLAPQDYYQIDNQKLYAIFHAVAVSELENEKKERDENISYSELLLGQSVQRRIRKAIIRAEEEMTKNPKR